MSKPQSAFEQVMAARFLTETFGALHSLQTENLEIWGYLVFQFCSYGQLEIQADVENKVVTYTLKTKKKLPNTARQKKLLESLKNGIETLLGPEWDLEVVQGKKTVYGKRRDPVAKKNEQRKIRAREGSGSTE